MICGGVRAALACALVLGAGSTGAEEMWADRAYDAITREIDESAIWFDGYFGDPEAVVEREASAFLHLTFEGYVSGVNGEDDLRFRLRGGADLPRFERRLRLFVTSDADAGLSGRDLAGVEPDATERFRDTGGLGLRYLLTTDPRNELGIGAGLAGGFSPEVVGNLRWRRVVSLGETVQAAATPNLYWGSDRGAGFSAVGEVSWLSDERTVWRVRAFGDLDAEDGETDWSGEATWLRRLDDDSSIRLALGARGEAGDEDLREVWIGVRWRRPAGRPWVFMSVEPGLSWHEKEDYAVQPTILVRLEALFTRAR
jgi:hypothetical protein